MPILLQINVVANWGSTGRIAEEIGQVAMANGWKSYIAYGRRGTPQSKSQLIRIGTNWNILWHGFQSRLFDNHGRASKKATRKLINRIQEIKPDIIHLHNIHGYYVNYEILCEYLAKTDIPVVWTFHDCWTFTGHCAHFSYVKCNQWLDGCLKCTQKRTYPSSYLLCKASDNYQTKKKVFTSIPHLTIVPVSNWLGNLVKQSFWGKYPIYRIYNGVNTQVFKPKEQVDFRKTIGVTKRYMLIGVATTWTSTKGLKDYYALREFLPEDEYAIVLIGLDKKQILDLPKGIKGVLRTNSVNELVSYYSAADIVLNLSYQETFGLTTVEGLACGTPGIAYNLTASPELISEETGFIVEPGDIMGVAHAVRIITTNGKQYYSAACRLRAEQCFNKAECWKEYVNLYQKLINEYI